jgi:PAS domain S-box-containing protein
VFAPVGPDGAKVILGMLEDITERKLAQERAGEGEQRFRVIAEQSMLGLMIFQDDRIRFVNQAVSDINGYSTEEMADWAAVDFARVIHPEDIAFVTEQGKKKQANDPSARAHYCYRVFAKSGELRWVEQYSRTIDYCGRTADFVTVIDITARKVAEESLTQLTTSMERTAKLEALGVLAAGIAHDFNNLLGGLFGHLELARTALDERSPVRANLDVAHKAFDRAKALKPGNLVAPLRKLAEHFGRRGIIVVISDFYAEPDEIFHAVGPIVHRGNDVVLFHVLDPQEIDFSFTEPSSFEDMESGDQMPIVPTKLAEDYQALVRAHIDTLTSKAGAQPVDYMLLNTAMPLDFALFRFLSMRQRLARTR